MADQSNKADSLPSAKRARGRAPCGPVGGGGCVVILIGLGVWLMSSQTPPAVRIPTPTMPNPNAFDTFQAAASQLLDSKKIDNVVSSPEAAKSSGHPMTALAERERLIAENSGALATLRSGLDQAYETPPLRSSQTVLPYYAKFRGLARFLAVDAGVHADRGDYGGAARSYLDAVEMGTQIPHGATVIGAYVGIACQAIGRKRVWPLIDHLNAAQAGSAARRLEKIGQLQFSPADTLQEEQWFGQASLLEMFRSPSELAENMTNTSEGDTTVNPSLHTAYACLFYMRYSKTRIMSDYNSYMDANVRRAREPYSAQRVPIPLPHDPIVELLAPVFEHFDVTAMKNMTQNGLLELALALRAYRLEHGKYPDSLSQLAPSCLSNFPTDPFTAGQPFRYKPIGSKYLLYSVGPDGVDDGGKPIDTGPSKSANKDQRYAVMPDSKGDIVAGKNTR